MDRADDLTALSGEELAAQREEAVTEFGRLSDIAPDDLTDEDVDEMESLAAYVEAIDAETERRDGEATARTERAAAAAARIAPVDDTQDETEDEPEAEADADDEQDEQDDAPQAVAAAATTKPRPKGNKALVKTARRPANPVPYTGTGLAITAAADVSGFAMGQELDDLAHVARAFQARAKGLPTQRLGGRNGLRQRYGVATLTRQYDGLVDSNPDFENMFSLAQEASRESRLPGGSLVASRAQGNSLTAAGWCAPSETLYGFCDVASLAGLWSGPEIGVTRGGIRFTPGPDYSTIYDECGFAQTEAQAIAGETKNCCTVDCPPFDEVRLDVIGYCVKAGILTNAAYPELVQQWLTTAMVANQHQKNAAIIGQIESELGAATEYADLGSSTFTTLVALNIAATGLRYSYRMALDATMEIVAPAWLRVAFQEDIQNQTGQTEPVSDDQIDRYLAARNLTVQWVYDWQDLTPPAAGGCVVDLPDTADVMIYPAGTFVLGTQDVISLDAMYDSTDLMTNVYTAAFAEDGWLLLHQCYGGCTLTLPVCITGRTGAADINTCAASTAPAA